MVTTSRIGVVLLTSAAATLAQSAFATTFFYEKDGTKAYMSGFAEFDAISDSTASLAEPEGNNPVEPRGTISGDRGRTTFSGRNSRLSLGMQSVQGSIKSTGYIETDLFGYEPTPGAGTPAETEGGYFQNAAVRVRHVYVQVEGDSWSVLAGQYWSLFGFQVDYLPSVVQVTAPAGALFERSPQVKGQKWFGDANGTQLLLALGLERPTERDSGTPDINAGAKLSFNSLRGIYTSPFGEAKPLAASLAVSGTMRQLTWLQAGSTKDVTTKSVAAIAVDGMLPLVGIGHGEGVGNNLTLTGEFTRGSGYGDELPNWSGNVAAPAGKAASRGIAAQPTIDPGIAGYNSAGALEAVQLQTWNSSLQYQLPQGDATWVTGGWGELSSANAASLQAASGKTVYDRTQVAFANAVHDFLPTVRGGMEFDWYRVSYATYVHALNRRLQLTAWYRF